jgi:hypothetical protein
MNKVSIHNMPENLLDEDQPNRRSKSQARKLKDLTDKQGQRRSELSLNALVSETASAPEIAIEELRNWVRQAIAPENVLKSILATAKRYQLNPLLGLIDWELDLMVAMQSTFRLMAGLV